MSSRIATTISVALLAGLSCLLTGFILTDVPIWAVFIAWASFFAAGANATAAKLSLTMTLAGVLSAAITLYVIGELGGSEWAVAGCVVFGAGILVFVSNVEILSFTPAGFFGFASTVGTVSATGTSVTDSLSLTHPLVLVVTAMIVGVAFGLVSVAGAQLLTTAESSEPAPVE